MNTSIDTLRAAETLRQAGVPERQAAAHAKVIDDAITGANLVTRDYLDMRLRTELATLRDQLTWRMLGGMSALLALFRLSEWLAS